MPQSLAIAEPLSSIELHAAWAPTKAKLVKEDRDEPLRIRVHRACKALKQAERIEASSKSRSATDAALVFRWVALNSLYGRWNSEYGSPMKDRIALDHFTTQACQVDQAGRIAASLETLTHEAKELLESPFLISHFWRSGEWDNVRPNRGLSAKFRNELLEGRPSAAVHRLLIAVYFLRCQIIHGGATLGSGMNRVTVEPAARVVRLLSSQLVAVVVDHGL
ncbi:hypothetical protein Poly30_28520 [Planctomycetes bacterium Poly30]|uniref:Apea-like HEPN domain-containing protein n=1 Tax=Saltatorellus ferox TaxID=2528018 RepID=A0A518ETB8_9BACT|nr:hypothetical protein Poly30_28520 [Planctomycetes bacterium Poly30]